MHFFTSARWARWYAEGSSKKEKTKKKKKKKKKKKMMMMKRKKRLLLLFILSLPPLLELHEKTKNISTKETWRLGKR